MKFLARWMSGVAERVSYYVRTVWRAYFKDDVFHQASALSFQVVLCLIPTVFLLTWLLSMVLSREALLHQLEVISIYALPRSGRSADELRKMFVIRAGIFSRHRGVYAAIALAGFFWTSLGLMGTLRKTIFHILGISVKKSFFKQALYDLRMLLIAGFFLTGSAVVTVPFGGVREAALQLPYGEFRMILLRLALPLLSGFGLTFLLYFTIYRFLSFGKLKLVPAAFGALWASILFELAKYLFAAYINSISTLSQVYGTLEVVVALLLWIFYSTTVFMIGVEMSNAYLKRRIAS